jgi:hypothetical protein
MTRATQFTIGKYLIAVPIIAYFCAFPELAVLLSIFIVTIAFAAPVLALSYLGCRYLGPRPLRNNGTAAALGDQSGDNQPGAFR